MLSFLIAFWMGFELASAFELDFSAYIVLYLSVCVCARGHAPSHHIVIKANSWR